MIGVNYIYLPQFDKKMFLITYHIKPKPLNPEFNKIGGAYVNCYIEADNFEEADLIARGEVENNNWDIYEYDSSKIVTQKDYIDNDENREYFEQALIDKEVFVFFTYPNE